MISRVIAAWRTLFMYSVRLRDHVRRVLRRRVHRRHLRGEERGVRFEQRAIDLHLDVARQQLVEDLLRRRLVQIVDLAPSPARRRAGVGRVDVARANRQQLVDDDPLRHHRLELVVDEHHPVDLARR